MVAHGPLFASDRTAARLLDMTRPQFLALVREGALPPPVAHDRWDVAQLTAIMRGKMFKPSDSEDLVL